MDNLEKFKPENLTKEVIDEINSMSSEDLKNLEDIPGFFLIRDKATNKTYTGQSTYKNLSTLHRLGFKKRYEVVGVHQDEIKNSLFDEVIVKDEFIAPIHNILNNETSGVIQPKKEISEYSKNGIISDLGPQEKNVKSKSRKSE